MLTGYSVGTEVKWNHDDALHSGTILKVYREFEAQTPDSPLNDGPLNYLILSERGGYIVLPHHDVMAKQTNSHM